jgi:hypothetical protein
MTSPSNLYAEKIFSEHPIALWALDDKLDFISLINEEDKSLSIDESYWTISGGAVSNNIPDGVSLPIVDSPFSSIHTDTESTSIDLLSREIFNSSEINQVVGSFNFSTYFYSDTTLITSVFIGYTDGTDTVIEPFSIAQDSTWLFLSKTFNLPEDKDIRLVIKINYQQVEGESDYNFYLNGMSVGQESEQHNMVSDGIYPQLIPDTIAIPESYGISSAAYGLQVSEGYYLSNETFLCARNYGIPMVYGTSNVTKMFPNTNNKPSMIVPGFGFLNQSGKNKDYTFEAWIKVNNNSLNEKRILGPISSNDGLYVDGPFLTLKIGESINSYCVKQWNRPMLINIVYTDSTSSLFVNGEQVFEMPILNTNFPDRLNEEGKEQDWIGFYAYDSVPVIEVDCVAIYSYAVPEIVAKRRFIYGQGVDFPENLNTGYNGTSVYVDYKFANYSNNYIYPDIGRWKQGMLENISVVNSSIETPEYSLPGIVIDYKYSEIESISIDEESGIITFESQNSFEAGEIINISGMVPNSYNFQGKQVTTVSEGSFTISIPDGFSESEITVFGIAKSTEKETESSLLAAIEENQEEISPYINLSPTPYWNNINSYMLLNSLNMLTGDVESFYGVFKSKSDSKARQVLFSIKDEASKNYFDISIIDGNKITYSIKYGEQEPEIIYQEDGYVTDTLLQVGVNLSLIASYYGRGVRSLFGNKNNLQVYIGGDQNIENKLNGNIYKIGFGTKRNTQKISNFFREDGIMINTSNVFNSYFQEGGEQIDFDYSGGVPSTWLTSSNVGVDVLDGGLYDTYGYPRVYSHVASYTLSPKTYLGNFMLDIVTDSYWQDYLPLKYFSKYVEDGISNKQYALDYLQFNVDYPSFAIFEGETYDTRLSNTKTYVSFKYVSDRGSSDLESLAFTQPVPKSNVVIPSSDWQRTAYEVLNDTVIYPPQNIDFRSLIMVIHIDTKASSSSNRKVRIKSLSVAGNSMNKTTPTQIGTRFGVPIVPTTRVGVYADYRSKNPLLISKQSAPYLQLGSSSGIGLLEYPSNNTRGLNVSVNPSSQSLYRVGAIQTAFKYRSNVFPSSPEQIFEISTREKTIKFFAVAANLSRTRGLIYAIDNDSKLPYRNLNIFINGSPVKYAYINASEWLMLGLQFPIALDYDNDPYNGLSITGKSFINNLAFYQISEIQNSSTFIFRSWGQVRSMLEKEDDLATTEIDESLLPTYWNDFLEGEYQLEGVNWGTVLFVPSEATSFLDPSKIYASYLGTNKTIIENEKNITFKDYEYRFYKDVEWQSSIITPV